MRSNSNVAPSAVAIPAARFASAGVNPSADNCSNSIASMMMRFLRFVDGAGRNGPSAKELRARRREAAGAWKRRRRALAGAGELGSRNSRRGAARRRVLRETCGGGTRSGEGRQGGKGNFSHRASPVVGPRHGRGEGTLKRARFWHAAVQRQRSIATASRCFPLSYRRIRDFRWPGSSATDKIASLDVVRMSFQSFRGNKCRPGNRGAGKSTSVECPDSNLLGDEVPCCEQAVRRRGQPRRKARGNRPRRTDGLRPPCRGRHGRRHGFRTTAARRPWSALTPGCRLLPSRIDVAQMRLTAVPIPDGDPWLHRAPSCNALPSAPAPEWS